LICFRAHFCCHVYANGPLLPLVDSQNTLGDFSYIFNHISEFGEDGLNGTAKLLDLFLTVLFVLQIYFMGERAIVVKCYEWGLGKIKAEHFPGYCYQKMCGIWNGQHSTMGGSR